ncbi:MAG: hypothetical protein R2752_10230 [Vicinamibacterales bacterium]
MPPRRISSLQEEGAEPPPPPPPPPAPVRGAAAPPAPAPAPTPPPVDTEETRFTRMSLSELNAMQPLEDVYFACDKSDLSDAARPAPAEGTRSG